LPWIPGRTDDRPLEAPVVWPKTPSSIATSEIQDEVAAEQVGPNTVEFPVKRELSFTSGRRVLLPAYWVKGKSLPKMLFLWK